MLTNSHELVLSHLHCYLPISPQILPLQNLNLQNTEKAVKGECMHACTQRKQHIKLKDAIKD